MNSTLFEAMAMLEQVELRGRKSDGGYTAKRTAKEVLQMIKDADKSDPLYREISQKAKRMLGENPAG
jgi:hypothetical protein